METLLVWLYVGMGLALWIPFSIKLMHIIQNAFDDELTPGDFFTCVVFGGVGAAFWPMTLMTLLADKILTAINGPATSP